MDSSSSPDEGSQLSEETEPPADDSPGMPSLPTGPPTPNPDTKGGVPRHPKTTLRELHRTRTLRVQAVLQELRARVTWLQAGELGAASDEGDRTLKAPTSYSVASTKTHRDRGR